MTLTAALQSAISSLNSINTAVNVTSQNVANATNKDYNTQEAIFTDVTNGGVRIAEIIRRVNVGLRNELLGEINTAAATAARNEAYELIEQLTGTLTGQTPLTDAIEEFRSAWKAFEAAPENDAARTDVVLLGQSVAIEIQRLSDGLDVIERQIRTNLRDTIGDVNDALAEIERLNDSIINEKASFRPTAELENLRDAEILKVAEVFDIQVLNKSDGSVAVYTTTGLDLVDSTASEFSFNEADFTLTKTGSGSTDLSGQLTDGRLAAEINLLRTDGTSLQSTQNGIAPIQKLRDQLDELTFSFVDVSVAQARGTQFVESDTDITTFTGVDAGDVITINVGGSDQTVTVGANQTAASLVAALNALTNVDARIDSHGQVVIMSNAGALTITDTDGAAAGLGIVSSSPQTFAQNVAVSFARAYQSEIATGATALTSTTDLIATTGLTDPSTFTVTAAGAGATTITIGTGAGEAQTAGDLISALNDVEGVRAELNANGFLEISSAEGSLVITDGANTPLASLGFITSGGVAVLEGSPNTGEAARFFEAETGTTPDNVSRVNFRVNDTLTSNAEEVKLLVGSRVLTALNSEARAVVGSGINIQNEDYTGLASGILVEVTRQGEVATRQSLRSEALRDNLSQALRDEVGVNTDEELARLTVLQNSFAATARVLSVVDEMFGTLETIVQ